MKPGTLSAALSALLLASATAALAQVKPPPPPPPGGGANPNCTATRSQIEADALSGLTYAQIQAKYAGCQGQPSSQKYFPIYNDYKVWTNFNINWEFLDSCGYHPQAGFLACTIEIEDTTGYLGKPGAGPVSFENVLFCLDFNDGNGLVPIGLGNVHVHDEAFGVNPSWWFSVAIPDNAKLFGTPLNGKTYYARALLSWLFAPANCGDNLITWGGWLDFKVRLDP
jgi:hypothetical protein